MIEEKTVESELKEGEILLGYMIYPGDYIRYAPQVAIHSADRGRCHLIKNVDLTRKCIAFSMMKVIDYPKYGFSGKIYAPDGTAFDDKDFWRDCIVFTLFHPMNKFSSKEGMINHWNVFDEVDLAIKKYKSNFMQDFIRGKDIPNALNPEARELWDAAFECVYHHYRNSNHWDENSSFYEIMNTGKNCPAYPMTDLTRDSILLRDRWERAVENLGKALFPKLEEHNFLGENIKVYSPGKLNEGEYN